MSKVALSCLTGGELTEYHDNARYMPRARCAEIAGHLAECGQCASDYVEVAEVAEFVRRALTRAVPGGQVSGEFVRDLKRMAEETVNS